MTYLDTHVVLWLIADGRALLPPSVLAHIEAEADLRISPMVRLEVQYLYELERVSEPAAVVLDALNASIGLTVCPAPFAAVAREADLHGWTRDPFDRLIVAQAMLHEAPLITRDRTIHDHYELALW